MTILILHGVNGHAGIHWMQWLYNELLKHGHNVIMPNLPHAEHPDRTEWLDTVKELTIGMHPDTLVLIGHSLGVATALDFIEQSTKPIKAIISVGGFADDYGSKINSFFMKERVINFEKVNNNVREKFVIYGDDDPHVPQAALSDLAHKLNASPTIIPKGGHLNTESGYTTFPLLLQLVNSLS